MKIRKRKEYNSGVKCKEHLTVKVLIEMVKIVKILKLFIRLTKLTRN